MMLELALGGHITNRRDAWTGHVSSEYHQLGPIVTLDTSSPQLEGVSFQMASGYTRRSYHLNQLSFEPNPWLSISSCRYALLHYPCSIKNWFGVPRSIIAFLWEDFGIPLHQAKPPGNHCLAPLGIGSCHFGILYCTPHALSIFFTDTFQPFLLLHFQKS